jgi:hypothetical protein
MTFNGQNVTNVQHFTQVGDDGTGDARNAIAQIWDDDFRVTLKAVLNGTVNIVQTRIRRIQPTQTQQLITAIGELGDGSGPAYPTGSCVIIRLMSISSGRKGTGGVKICGMNNTDIALGRLNVAAANKLQTHANVYADTYTDSGSNYVMVPVVYSRIDNVGREILSAVILTRVKTVHSRQVGVGQ